MSEVFISYSRKDKLFAQRLHAALLERKRNTWVDWQDILPTEKWWKAIENGIEAADTFVFIISPDSVASEVCFREIDHAVKHRKRLVPIVHREVDPKQVHPSLSAHNWLFMRESDDFDLAFSRLIEAIDTDLEHARIHTRILVRAVEWEREGRDDSFLLRGKDLTASERWLRRGLNKYPAPTDLQIEYIHASRELPYRRPRVRHVVLASAAVTLAVVAVRFLGLLRPLELAAYDHLMRVRPSEPQDERFLIVAIDEATSRRLDEDYGIDRAAALPGAALNQVLETLEPLQPRLIGLDFYRPGAAEGELANRLRQTSNLVALCKASYIGENGQRFDGTVPPPEVPLTRVGFADLVDDGGRLIRRHLVDQAADSEFCNTTRSFSFVLASQYLAAEGVAEPAIATPAGDYLDPWNWGQAQFRRLGYGSGYQWFDLRGYQVMLNYRAPEGDPARFAEQISLVQLLDGSVSEEQVKDRIVLIGITDGTYRSDLWYTPYGRQVPGVTIQGQMTSQIISAALDGRAIVWWLPAWMELLWLLGWSLIGGFIVWYFQRPLYLALAFGATVIVIYGVSYFVFASAAGWLPLVPTVLVLVLTAASIGYMNYRLRKTW